MTKTQKKLKKARRHAASKASRVPSKATLGDSVSSISRQITESQATSIQISNLQDELISVDEACELVGISRSTLDRAAKSESIPGRVKILGRVRYHRPTLEAWLTAQVTSAL